MNDYPVTSAAGQDMLSDLPSYYEPILEIRIIVQSEGAEFDKLQADLAAQLNQRFVGTATWDLVNWEEELGIIPLAGQPIDQRRSVIQSKMRGIGKFTGSLLKRIAEAYNNGEVDLSFDAGKGMFTVTFVSTLGIPPNMDDIKNAIRAVMPSHLIVKFVFRYATFGMLQGYGKSFGNIETVGITFGAIETWGG
ncbi:hypothetical protein Back11_11830 [Paenibacillus baekrokdamisoli]|uniref:Uncharacterized protein n=1 Tax=Paenibacillus baekrokdamisoli TaxID=1712516 RepID=A0A3G9J7P2_9BACL|nr:putative phage tail protein [Paenibacillus baekrokdamisoli]MBB3070488.1 hypothetical protein [Paenibacillus baekrokdamisoli]BBH19838.1 hypothetical protein Back11_11830 [Paenibacillus baekrokdamisoli]